MIALVATALAYLLGSLSGSLLLGRRLGIDIRQHGSGNAGGTNALRTRGWRFALAVAAIDVGKGALAVGLAAALIDPDRASRPYWLVAAALAAVAGHVWPIYYGFRGGKGAATLIGASAVLWPLALLPMLGSWLLALLLSGYVGPSTVLAAATLLPMAWFDPALGRWPFALAAVALIGYTHRGNLQRWWRGEEYCFERARLLRRRRSR